MPDYLYDGTYDGFLSCLYRHFAIEPATTIQVSGHYQVGWTSAALSVKTNRKRSAYMYDQLMGHLGLETAKDIYYSYLSQAPGWEQITLSFVDLCFRQGARYKAAFTHDRVYPFYALVRKVKREVERYIGYTRFEKLGGCLYGKIHPECFILPALEPHFTDRYSTEKFIIHDGNRNLALISKDGESFTIVFTQEDLKGFASEDPFKEIWRDYVDTIAIKSRINPKLQQQFVPLKYRKDLVEMQPKKTQILGEDILDT